MTATGQRTNSPQTAPGGTARLGDRTVARIGFGAHYENTLLIPGTSDPAHLAENIAAGSLRLAPASVTALDQLAGPE
jgi:pyridoxine 4-dehydrogenase